MSLRRALLPILFALFTPLAASAATARATFAMGCFWCAEDAFEKVDGVIGAVSGYIGGKVDNPTYEQVSYQDTGHYEAIEVTYDPAKVSYAKLLDVFWRNVDPHDGQGQFCDKGDQYLAAIFTHDAAQKQAAEASFAAVQKKLGAKVQTRILPATKFWVAEQYHQDYYKKNPVRYKLYKFNCGREARLKKVWGK